MSGRIDVPDSGRRRIDVIDFALSDGDDCEIGTTIRVESLRPTTRICVYKTESLADVFSAANLRRNMLIAFLQRLVSLRTQLGEFVITFETRYPKGGVDRSSLSASDLPEVTDARSTDIAERDPRSSDSGDTSGTADLVFTSAPNGPASGAPSPNSAARSTQRSAGTCIKISRTLPCVRSRARSGTARSHGGGSASG